MPTPPSNEDKFEHKIYGELNGKFEAWPETQGDVRRNRKLTPAPVLRVDLGIAKIPASPNVTGKLLFIHNSDYYPDEDMVHNWEFLERP